MVARTYANCLVTFLLSKSGIFLLFLTKNPPFSLSVLSDPRDFSQGHIQ